MTGDLRKLHAVIIALEGVSQLGPKLGKNLGAEALKLVADGFREQRDPYGQPWSPSYRARHTENGQTLRDTGRLANSVSSPKALSTRPDGFTVSTNVKYAAIHQFGGVIKAKNAPYLWFPLTGATKRGKRGQELKRAKRTINAWVKVKQVTIPARPFFPKDQEPGPIWGPAFIGAAQALVRKHFPG